ncbi:MAG: serine/threonine-protein kinase [Balneolaceae bacterium]|nr:serine/threonine-protein kinase [Balneolaceae bacterium]
MKDLTQKRWLQIDSLLKKVLEKPPEERLNYIKYSSGSDPELWSHIENLLQLHEEAENIIGESAGTFAAPIVPGLLDELEGTDRDFDHPGAQVGPYDILETIGRGGMGAVYLAHKTSSPYDKKVALKLVRRGMDTADVVRRFRNEGQILASLEHPNIARLYDGGIHTDGRPWFVMEYIQGEPIDIYSDRTKCSIKERLRLFRIVCEAVHFAHQSLIVHRDIKPANVLVTREGHIKLLDFGIAKLLEPNKMELTDYRTRTGMKLMTPEFAAPEQIQGKPITTASDIYALGVLLYLLVTGRRPYRLGTASMLEIERTVCHKTPVRPSDAVIGKPLPAPPEAGEDTFDPQEAARLRGKNAESLKKELTGDLDRIVLKALRKEPDRRYRSALAFAEDIDNYLAGKPVQARPSTFRYRTQKFISRNRWAVTATAVALFLIFTGLGIAIWQARVAQLERDIAQQEAAKAKAAQDYLVQLFETADPAENRGAQLTAREIVRGELHGLKRTLVKSLKYILKCSRYLDVLNRHSEILLFPPNC